MLKKVAAAIIATSLIAGPALAQGNTTAPTAIGHPAKAGTKTGVKSSLNTYAVHKKHVTHKPVTKKHVTAKHVSKRHLANHHVAKHHAKKVHVSKAKHFHNGKTVKRVPAKPFAG